MMKAIAYLNAQFKGTGFLAEWKALSDKDKQDMKDYAVAEGTALGLGVTP